MKYEKECIVCGKSFATDDCRKITCSRECQKARQRELQRKTIGDYCDVCGRYFERPISSSRATCSSECAKKLRSNGVSKTKKKKPKSSLALLVEEAREKGISYGQLQGQKLLAEMREAE